MCDRKMCWMLRIAGMIFLPLLYGFVSVLNGILQLLDGLASRKVILAIFRTSSLFSIRTSHYETISIRSFAQWCT